MATLAPPELTPEHHLDEQALIEEAREARRRRRRRRRRQAAVALAAVAVAGLIGDGAHRLVTSTTSATGPSDAPALAATCSHVHVRFLGADATDGAAFTAGILVKAAVSASTACRFEGYPTVDMALGNGSSSTASDLRSGIFGGFEPAPTSTADMPLHSFKITSRPRTVSFTIEWTTGNGWVGCPRVTGLRFRMPDSHQPLAFHSVFEGGVGRTSFLGYDCGHVNVTPTVPGATGKSGW